MSLRRDILLSAIGGALLCGTLTQLGQAGAAHSYVDARMADLQATVGPERLAGCAQDPEHWTLQLSMMQVTAHDPQGRSANPMAPTLPEGSVPELGAPPTHSPQRRARIWERSVTQRIAASGPCAALHARFPEEGAAMPSLRFGGALGVFLATVLVFIGTSLFALHPLLRRLRRLDAATSAVGTAAYHPVEDPREDELGRVARAVDASHARIRADQEALTRRGEVLERHLAAVAHDLRTPLASLQLTLEDLGARLPAELSGELADARLELSSVEAIADNLLQASRLRGGLEVAGPGARVDLNEVLARLVTRSSILGRGRGVRVHAGLPEAPTWARCEPALAERALSNLLHNALEHGPAGQPVGVALDREDGRFTLTIQSAGEPLSAERLASFAARRLDPEGPARSRAAAGLGLGIANQVAASAGWAIRYLAAEGGGLRVELSGALLDAEDLEAVGLSEDLTPG